MEEVQPGLGTSLKENFLAIRGEGEKMKGQVILAKEGTLTKWEILRVVDMTIQFTLISHLMAMLGNLPTMIMRLMPGTIALLEKPTKRFVFPQVIPSKSLIAKPEVSLLQAVCPCHLQCMALATLLQVMYQQGGHLHQSHYVPIHLLNPLDLTPPKNYLHQTLLLAPPPQDLPQLHLLHR